MTTTSQGRAEKLVSNAISALNLGTASTLDQNEVVLESQRNVPDGFIGLNSEGVAEAAVRIRNGTITELGDDLVPADGELIALRDDNGAPTSLRIGDGTTVLGQAISGSQRFFLSSALVPINDTNYYDVTDFNFTVNQYEVWEIFVIAQWYASVDGLKFTFTGNPTYMHFMDPNEAPYQFTGGLNTPKPFVLEYDGSAFAGGTKSCRVAFQVILDCRFNTPANSVAQLQIGRFAASNAPTYVAPMTMVARRLA